MNGIGSNTSSGRTNTTHSSSQNNPPPQTERPTSEHNRTEFIAQSILQNSNSLIDPTGRLSTLIPSQGAVAAAITPPLITRESMKRGLEDWVNNGGMAWNRDDRKVAAKKILKAYNRKETQLDLSGSSLSSLPSEIGNLVNLEELCLSNNRLTVLPTDIGNLENLKELELSRNQLTDLPTEIGNLKNLQGLRLDRNNFTAIPKEIGNLTNLQALDLDGNKLTAIPKEIGNLTNLKELDLRNNELVTLPVEIGNLTNLQELDLYWNKFTTLPTAIGNLANLKVLILSRNELTALPAQIGNLTNLLKFYFSYNQLTALPTEIGNLAYLEDLDIAGNRNLRSLPMTLGHCHGITELYTSETQIPDAERDAILGRTRAARDAEGHITLPARLATWQAYGEITIDLRFLSNNSITIEQRANINEWLIRLEKCRDFEYNRGGLAKLACNMLATLNTSPEFKDAFFGHLEGNLTNCEDRAAMLLNFLYTDYMLYTIDPNANDKEKIELFVKLAKTLTLRETLEEMVMEYQKRTNTTLSESVEIYLYYEITNRDLGLLTAIENMFHTGLGNAPNIVNREQLRAAVNAKYMDILGNQEALDKILAKYPEYQENVDAIVANATQKLATINPKKLNSAEYKNSLEALSNSRMDALRDLRKKYASQILEETIQPSNMTGHKRAIGGV